jgi:signal transduction histidine kinase
VADNGIGMDAAALGEIQQQNAEPPGAVRCAGLGLRIVHQVVSAHGGRLHLESLPGGGTTVRIDLPAVSTAPAARAGLT